MGVTMRTNSRQDVRGYVPSRMTDRGTVKSKSSLRRMHRKQKRAAARARAQQTDTTVDVSPSSAVSRSGGGGDMTSKDRSNDDIVEIDESICSSMTSSGGSEADAKRELLALFGVGTAAPASRETGVTVKSSDAWTSALRAPPRESSSMVTVSSVAAGVDNLSPTRFSSKR